MPVLYDCWNKKANAGAISCATDFRSFGGNSSGPHALDGLRAASCFSTLLDIVLGSMNLTLLTRLDDEVQATVSSASKQT